MPFGELAWDHARRHLVTESRSATEEQIAGAVATLLRRAHHGPEDQEKPKMSKRDRRVAARTRAATPQAEPASKPPGDPAGTPEPMAPGDGTPVAEVIPLGIFDPFREADKRW